MNILLAPLTLWCYIRYARSAGRVYDEAERAYNAPSQDEERAYVLFMKYAGLFQAAKKTKDYKQNKVCINYWLPSHQQTCMYKEVIINSSKKVLQFKFDLLYITLFSVFSTKIGIIRKRV